MTVILTVIYVILMFVLLIVPHEFGHFITAKAVGIKVNEFSFGMGPKLFQKRKGETLYSVRALPIGGYCAMEGENEENDDPRSFNNKPGWAKIIVLAAGAVFNILTAVVIMAVMFTAIGFSTTKIDKVTPGSPAAEAGLKKGDRLVAVQGTEIKEWNDLGEYFTDHHGKTAIQFKRDGEMMSTVVTPEKSDGRYIIGVQCVVSHNPLKGVKYGAEASFNMLKLTYKSFGMLFSGEASVNDMSGPVGIVSVVNKTASTGFLNFMVLTCLLCMNLAVVNLFPLPALDGGRILMVIIRKLTGHMITDEMEAKINLIGFALLMALMIFITWNDISKLIS
jgi:regulator of sigma E protease